MIRRQSHIYSDGKTEFVGWLVWEGESGEPRPGVLVTPAFGGLGDFDKEQAEKLARLGYVVLAVDYYGGGKHTTSREEASALMAELNDDRELLASRMVAALNELKSLPQVNPDKTGAIGYCFGGKAVLDLARAGAELSAAVTFHGVLDAPSSSGQKMNASVLVLHGWDDPLATPEDLVEFSRELTGNCEDWQVLAFGHTSHAFTNPQANMRDAGMMYDNRSSSRAWRAMTGFLEEQLLR